MFDYATSRPGRPVGRSRLVTAGLSAVAHVAALIAIAVPALYATSALPEPRSVMAFVVAAAPPAPPPPPAPAPAPAPKPKAKPRRAKARPAPVPAKQPLVPVVPVAAPMEAPEGITAETGLEVFLGADSSLFEGVEGGIAGGVIGGVVGGIDKTPPPPPPARTPIRIGGDLTPPRLTHRVEPVYPLIAQSAQIQGVVILEAIVNRQGHVEAVRVLRSHALLEDAAIEAVEQWEYEPLTLNGDTFPFILTVTVSFRLG